MNNWLRVRFMSNAKDWRPVKWPPPGPFWCTGYGNNTSIIVAYVKAIEQISEFWPEVKIPHDIDFVQEREEIVFTDRFLKPEWWAKEKEGETENA